MRIAVSQLNTKAGDFRNTVDRMVRATEDAARRDCDLVVFGFCTLTGPDLVNFAARAPFLIDFLTALEDLSKRAACACLVPALVALGESYSYEAFLVRDGQVELTSVDMAFLEEVIARDDASGLRRKGPVRFELFGSEVGLAFSNEDLDAWCDERPVDVIFFLNCLGYANDYPASALGAAIEEGNYQAIACETGAWIVCANSVGCYGDSVFSGSSFVLAPSGGLAAAAQSFEEDFIVVEVGAGVTLEPVDEFECELYDERLFIWQSVTLGIRDYAKKNLSDDVALLVDGSISSMFLAVAASDALGPTHVHVLLNVPKSSARVEEAKQLMRALHVDVQTAPVDDVDDEELARDIAQAHFATLARKTHSLPLSSFDKTAFAVELPSVQLDAGRFAPLGDLYRTVIVDVVRMRNTFSPILPSLKVLPEDLPDIYYPSDGWTDALFLAQVDSALTLHIELDYDKREVDKEMNRSDVATAAITVCHAHGHCRTALPEVLALSSKTMAEAKMPSGLGWHDPMHYDCEKELRDAFSRLRPMRRDNNPVERMVRRATPEDLEEHGSELREAFQLMRDLTMGSDGLWTDQFSEN